MEKKEIIPQLPHEELLQLKRWNHADHLQWMGTASQHGSFQTAINLGVTTDFMPQMGPMVGWAVMLQIEPS